MNIFPQNQHCSANARQYAWRTVARLLLQWLLVYCVINIPSATAEALAYPRWSQLADTAFQHLTTDHGLPHLVITSLAEDGDGFLWVGSQGGLGRWDGYRFRRFLNLSNDNHSLPDNLIQSLYTDLQGRLWVGTNGGGLARFDRGRDYFVNIPAGPNGLSHATVHAVADDGMKGVWVGTEGGLDHVAANLTSVSHVRHRDNDPRSLPDNRVQALLRDKNGTLWVGTQNGLARKDGESDLFDAVPLQETNGQQPTIAKLFQASDGKIWVGTQKHGVYIVDPSGGNPQALAQLGPELAALANETVFAIIEPRPGQFWLGSYGQGIAIYDRQSGQVRRIRHEASLPGSLADNWVWCMHLGRGGLLWVGSTRGLDRHDPTQTAILSLLGAANRQDGVADPDVREVQEMPNGKIWLRLGSAGIDILDPASGQIARLPSSPGPSDSGLPQANLTAITPGVDGEVFVGTGQGLLRSNPLAQTLRRFTLQQGNRAEPGRVFLREHDNLWIGSQSDGVTRLKLTGPAAGEMTRIDGLSDKRIVALEAGAAGTVWIATENGLNLYHPDTQLVEQIKANGPDDGALAANFVSSLLTDRQGRLWVGSLGGGICVLTGRDKQGLPRFQRLGTAQGLPSANIGKLLMAGDGTIWASTAQGLIMIDPKSYAVRSVQRADGLNILSYWVGSGLVTTHGELLFGGLGGLTVVRPDQFKDWTYLPPIVVTDVRVGGKPITADQYNGNPGQEPLSVAADANSLAVEFSALDYSAPEQNRYAYLLDGYDKEWISTDATRRLAAYTNLPPGDYRLRLRGSNRNGVFNKTELVLPIRVLPAWYQSWWCRLAGLLVGLGILFALLQGRTAYLRQRQGELENQVSQRTKELHQKQVELVDANAELAVSAETLRQLGDIGREITANLTAEAVFDSLHRHIGGLLDANSIAVYRSNATGNALLRTFARESGRSLPSVTIALDSPTSNAARAARERREVLMERLPNSESPNHNPGTQHMLTALFAPLITHDRLLGVMSIQSPREHAYGEREQLIFRTLCAYGAIAVDNSNAYQQLHDAQAQLMEQEKLVALGSLVGGVAHELNTPLGNSLMMTSALQENINELNTKINQKNFQRSDLVAYLSDAQEATTLILRGLTSAAKLISSFKQVAVDRSTAQRRVFDLQQTSREVIATMMNQIRPSGHVIHFDIAPGITMKSFPGSFGQVLANMIDNAMLHGFDGCKHGVMRLSANKNGTERVLIRFEDDGVGIAPQHIKRVFEPFFTTKMGHGGNGLGMSISYNIVTSLLGGTISVESTLGKGTVFTLDLPLTAELDASIAQNE